MKYINDKNNEIIRSYRSNRKLWQRVLSFVTVLALVTNTMYTGGLLKYVDFTAILRAESAGEVPSYTTDNDASSYGSDIGFDDTGAGIKKFLDYCYYFY
ncbi:conserved domain protein, partial [Ruminococcus albus 8]